MLTTFIYLTLITYWVIYTDLDDTKENEVQNKKYSNQDGEIHIPGTHSMMLVLIVFLHKTITKNQYLIAQFYFRVPFEQTMKFRLQLW